MTRPALPALTALALLPAGALAQVEGEVGRYSDATVQGSFVEPAPVEVADDAELAGLIAVPAGFEVSVAGRDLGNVRMLAVHGGHVYATRRLEGDVIRLVDANGDGVFEDHVTVATQPQMHGIAFHGDTAFLVTVKSVFTAPVNEDGSFGELTEIIDDLPDGGQHPNRTLAVGPDGMLYVTVGSTCNACAETDDESATILRANLDGTGRQVFAQGLRNTIGFGWTEGGDLYGADMGIDWLGDAEQPEELNLVEQGSLYGWPYVYADNQVNPQDNPEERGEGTIEEWQAKSTAPVLDYTAHASPLQMAFYEGEAFPEEYRGDAFVAMHGSWNRRPPSGYELARVDFEDGRPVAWEPFATGFLIDHGDEGTAEGTRWGFVGRPAGVVVTPEGDLLLGDDALGVIYRIRHAGE